MWKKILLYFYILFPFYVFYSYSTSNHSFKSFQKKECEVIDGSKICIAHYNNEAFYYLLDTNQNVRFIADKLVRPYCIGKNNYHDCLIDRTFYFLTLQKYKPYDDKKTMTELLVQDGLDCGDRVNLMSSILHYLKIDDYYYILLPHHMAILVRYKDIHRFKDYIGAYIKGKKYIFIETTSKKPIIKKDPFSYQYLLGDGLVGSFSRNDVKFLFNPVRKEYADPNEIRWGY
ncbi:MULTISPECIES: hypothetical protein [unclassified Nitratiruptor]|uniref:hypothetical protein n=1 Tax=unclassified Nitratiruptor TaxID=2624044 RepID=UPI0019161C62|nr:MULTISPECIES: hypothetical protein [unclassified Nitratiruptor]BCD60028.1 hypothetical protein NitYY0810_C0791 [Nitratiruptor sp. YY08-10]BCD63951.1 hypothetical protein NitYY0814_C0790 [Nitratiruptor sp. YY08-14]BCD64480.1 hypothetical protein NitYY0814_C1327 [Nitratiruptor sp. YY08-14]